MKISAFLIKCRIYTYKMNPSDYCRHGVSSYFWLLHCSKLFYGIRKILHKKQVHEPVVHSALAHLLTLPDNDIILQSNDPDWLAGLVEREYYLPASKYNGYYSMRAANQLRDMYKKAIKSDNHDKSN